MNIICRITYSGFLFHEIDQRFRGTSEMFVNTLGLHGCLSRHPVPDGGLLHSHLSENKRSWIKDKPKYYPLLVDSFGTALSYFSTLPNLPFTAHVSNPFWWYALSTAKKNRVYTFSHFEDLHLIYPHRAWVKCVDKLQKFDVTLGGAYSNI